MIVDDDLAQTPNPGSNLDDAEWEALRVIAFGDGSNAIEVCGLPMEQIGETDFWYCPSCDRRDAPELLAPA